MLLIKNGLIHTVTQEEPFVADILVKGGKIEKIDKNISVIGVKVVDAEGKFVYPGLVDCHSHLGLDGYAIGYESQDYNEINDPVTPQLNARDAFYPQDRSINMAAIGGVTAVSTGPGSSNVLGGSFIAVKTDGVCVDEMIIKDNVAVKCSFGENPKRVYRDKGIFSRMSIAAKLRDTLNKAIIYKNKKEAAQEQGDISTLPEYNDKLEALIPVIERKVPLKAHAHRTDDIFTAIRIAKEFNLKMTLEHCTDGHLIPEYLKEAGFPIAVGPSFGHATKYELKNKTFKTPGILAKAGCHVSIITDSPVIPQYYLGLCAGLAVKSGMDKYEALKAITINPAIHMGVEDRIGTLEVGKDADIIIADGCIMDYQTTVLKTFINGCEVEKKEEIL